MCPVTNFTGWILFMIFAGVGMFAAPISWIQEFLGRPTTTITKSEYMRRARLIFQRAKECVVRGSLWGAWKAQGESHLY